MKFTELTIKNYESFQFATEIGCPKDDVLREILKSKPEERHYE